jgi:hypothetical protein
MKEETQKAYEEREENELNTFYYLNAVTMEKADGALRCQITRRQLDKVLAENHEMIVSLSPHEN